VNVGDADTSDSADGQTSACNGVIPMGRCFMGASGGGTLSPPFDLQACGLVTDGEAGVSCKDFCVAQNPGLYAECATAPMFQQAPGMAVCYCGSLGGRPAEGLELSPRCVRNVADFLAASAETEAASVDAFEILETELRAHGAPAHLVRASRAAARDERNHARAMRSLARARGAEARETPITRSPVRSLEAIATENAVVGCVTETYAALVAQWQAAHARDAEIAQVMEIIARDEARHAGLAWRVHAWALERLPADERDRVTAKLQEAISTLASRVETVELPDREAAGLPSQREGRALAVALAESFASLW
jgi:rubrerythrin